MIRTFFLWTFFGISISIGHLVGLIFSIFYRREEVFYRIALFIPKGSLWIGGIKVEIMGAENIPKENMIFVSNHQSTTDGFIFLVLVPRYFRFAVMQQIFAVPILGGFIKKIGYILLDLTNPKQALIGIWKIFNLLQRGETFVIFPEGGRSPDGRLLEFRAGAAMLILEAKKRVVPVAILNSYKVMQRDDLLGIRVRPGLVRVRVGKPMTFDEYQEVNLENARTVSARLKETIQRLISEYP